MDFKKEIEDLKKEVQALKERRIIQSMILPDVVKMRHMGEANRYIWAGLESELPPGGSVTNSVIAYFCTDSFKLKIWTGTAYKSVTLS